MEEIRKFTLSNIPIIIVGNKSDLEAKVALEMGIKFAKKHNFQHFETSAKTGENVERAFLSLTSLIYDCILSRKKENLIQGGTPLVQIEQKKKISSTISRNCSNLPCSIL